MTAGAGRHPHTAQIGQEYRSIDSETVALEHVIYVTASPSASPDESGSHKDGEARCRSPIHRAIPPHALQGSLHLAASVVRHRNAFSAASTATPRLIGARASAKVASSALRQNNTFLTLAA